MNLAKKNDIKLWLYTKDNYIESLSEKEKSFLRELNNFKKKQYSYSRSFLRQALSLLLDIEPLELPIIAPPGEKPKLQNDLGFLSLSHCIDALLVGWSTSPIGVDIENSNRIIKNNKVFKKILCNSELKKTNFENKNQDTKKLLKIWVIKEAIIKQKSQSLIKDGKEWEFVNTKKMAFNQKENQRIKVLQDNLYGWEIGIACNSLANELPIICFDNT